RIGRGECLSLRARDFVDAARALGASHRRILLRHVLVNALPALIVQATLLLGQTILIESGLSYLGLGAQPPLPSWGNMVVEGRQFLGSAWWVSTFPGVAIFVKDLVIGYLGDATSLNPVVATDGQSYIAEWPMFDSLVELDEKLGVRPLLAESWEVSKDGLTWTFRLKKGVKWHDGKPFTARDVAFTFYSVLDPKVTTPHRAYFDALVGFPELTNKDNPKRPEELAQKPIEVVDDHTVRFRLRYPYGAFLAVLVSPRAGIIPEPLLKGADLNTAEFNRKPVGTGP